jgi:hypothetical protein
MSRIYNLSITVIDFHQHFQSIVSFQISYLPPPIAEVGFCGMELQILRKTCNSPLVAKNSHLVGPNRWRELVACRAELGVYPLPVAYFRSNGLQACKGRLTSYRLARNYFGDISQRRAGRWEGRLFLLFYLIRRLEKAFVEAVTDVLAFSVPVVNNDRLRSSYLAYEHLTETRNRST